MADWEIPLAAASLLKSSSQLAKLPVPQDAASSGDAGIVSAANTAKVLKIEPGVIGTISSEMILERRTFPGDAKYPSQPRPKQGPAVTECSAQNADTVPSSSSAACRGPMT